MLDPTLVLAFSFAAIIVGGTLAVAAHDVAELVLETIRDARDR